MNLQQILNFVKIKKPESTVLMVINVNNKIATALKIDGQNEYDIWWTIKNNELIPYSPLKYMEMKEFHDACKHPIFKKKDSLSHHGVKGMHWGIRKEYEPVGRDSRRRTITKGDTDPDISKDESSDGNAQKLYNAFMSYKNASEGHTKGPLDTNNLIIKRGQNDLDLSSHFNAPSGSVVLADSLTHINPNYWTSNDASVHNNCPNCSLAVELNKRGYSNFSANPNGPLTKDEIEKLYPGIQTHSFLSNAYKTNGTDWCNDVKKYVGPPGSHGFISGNYKPNGYAGGHIFNYTVLEDGTVQVEDGQCGLIMTLEAAAEIYDFAQTYVMDATNANINLNRITDYGAINESDQDFSSMYGSAQKLGAEIIKNINRKLTDPKLYATGQKVVTRLLRGGK